MRGAAYSPDVHFTVRQNSQLNFKLFLSFPALGCESGSPPKADLTNTSLLSWQP